MVAVAGGLVGVKTAVSNGLVSVGTVVAAAVGGVVNTGAPVGAVDDGMAGATSGEDWGEQAAKKRSNATLPIPRTAIRRKSRRENLDMIFSFFHATPPQLG
jgi:hypothetical protein